jgi:hypothetical protein
VRCRLWQKNVAVLTNGDNDRILAERWGQKNVFPFYLPEIKTEFCRTPGAEECVAVLTPGNTDRVPAERWGQKNGFLS